MNGIMRAFKVHLNGEQLCVAGFDGEGVLNTVVNHIAGHGKDTILELRVGGLISATEEHVDWYCAKLAVGDKVALTIIETDSADQPANRHVLDSLQPQWNSRAYLRAVVRKFGWKMMMWANKSK